MARRVSFAHRVITAMRSNKRIVRAAYAILVAWLDATVPMDCASAGKMLSVRSAIVVPTIIMDSSPAQVVKRATADWLLKAVSATTKADNVAASQE